MKINCLFLLMPALLISGALNSQTKLPVPRNISETYLKGTRTTDGKPGKNYWQNSADYNLTVSFDPSGRLINGVAAIDYFNNSPNTLNYILFKLYPNYYKRGAQRFENVNAEDIGDGILIDSIKVNKVVVITYKTDGTNMTVTVPPVFPTQKIHLDIYYHYTLNKGSHMRTGQVEDNAAFIAYFFPRIAVYDDIDGWDKYQYVGAHEFYNDFCNFKAAITVPKQFIVWATGDLKNCDEVFKPTYCSRIKLAETNDSVTAVISQSDLSNEIITADNVFNTWKFEATNITDFVFATSNHYVWKSSSVVVDNKTKRRTRVDAVYNPRHTDYDEVIHFNRATVKAMSYTFPKWPFPYSHETIFDGLDQMEYPMMANDKPIRFREDAITLTNHEVFHAMFPFYMGINETKYAWMEEGWATLSEWLISPMIDSTVRDEYGMNEYNVNAGKELDVPITTLTVQQADMSLFLNSYPKPALGYLFVKDMLGEALFTKALHYYISQWHGKHPMPYDFFNCMNTGSGKNLNWFWKRWFFDNGVPDLSIKSVSKKGNLHEIVIESKGSKPVPVDLSIQYSEGPVKKVHRDVSVWESGNTTVTITITDERTPSYISLGSLYVPDVNKGDNVYVP